MIDPGPKPQTRSARTTPSTLLFPRFTCQTAKKAKPEGSKPPRTSKTGRSDPKPTIGKNQQANRQSAAADERYLRDTTRPVNNHHDDFATTKRMEGAKTLKFQAGRTA
jgi:hypothetical protein